jgi:RNA polymerase-binding transcription factor DksA
VKVFIVNKKDQKHFQKRLHEELANLAKALGKLEKSVMQRSQRESSGDLSAYSIHMADLGTDAMERERDLLLASAEGRTVLQIREALNKLEDGTYGTCEECGKPIGAARLEMIPYAVYCSKCQVKLEKSQ